MCKAKIIGTGMIANAMDIPFDVIIFASGVSNSQCVSDALFKREIDLFKKIKKDKKIVYFSTITVHQKHKTPYIKHKILMEKLVEQYDHIILRLPNLIGQLQSNVQLVPSLINQIIKGEVNIQENASRCILDVEDISKIVIKFIKKNGIFNIFGRPVFIEDLVHQISDILGVKPKINFIPAVEYPIIKHTIEIDTDYYSKILKKYLSI